MKKKIKLNSAMSFQFFFAASFFLFFPLPRTLAKNLAKLFFRE
jgi:hypothetical protein